MREQARGSQTYLDGGDLICLSHLRWDFVYQRPQHLLSRCARERRVFFVEEPQYGQEPAWLQTEARADGLHIVVPHLPRGVSEREAIQLQQQLLETLLTEQEIDDYILWYYTPMALPFTRQLAPRAVIYDCMDELSAFRGAPPVMLEREEELFRQPDLIFTGGQSLYEAKQGRHPHVHLFPSSIDRAHFGKARNAIEKPKAQVALPHPRLGYFGVIDEHLDLELIRGVAEARPEWQIVMIGPTAKIDPATLPQAENIHYMGCV